MALIEKNDYGGLALNDKVIDKMIVEDLLSLPESLILCNKKGKIIKNRGSKKINPDCYDAVEVHKENSTYMVKVYCINRVGSPASAVSDKLIRLIEHDFEIFNLPKPGEITISFKGVFGKELSKRNIEVTRKNV